jgi:hypothetical protein
MRGLRRVPLNGQRALRVGATTFVLVICAFAPARSAGAIGLPTSFNMSPSSGPVGTTVNVSGTGCTGFVSRTVTVTASTVPQTLLNASAAADGSWHGSFSIPAGTPAAPVAVVALCLSDGLPLAYTPKTFTVTGSLLPTTPALPSTTLPGATLPATTTPDIPGGPGSPNSSTSSSVAVPPGRIDRGAPGRIDRTGGGARGDGTSGRGSSGATAPGKDGSKSGPGTRAAELRSPELSASRGGDGGDLGWLLWVLALSVPIGGFALCIWMRRARGRGAPDLEGESA